MTKYKLDVDYDYSFDLIGICCHQKDYRLCWSVNGALKIHLEKNPSSLLVQNKSKQLQFPYYTYRDIDNRIDYQLIKNKVDKDFLIQEKHEIDYFLLIHNNFIFDVKDILTELKKIDLILACYLLDIGEIKFKELLIF